jgi:hypothetical protein
MRSESVIATQGVGTGVGPVLVIPGASGCRGLHKDGHVQCSMIDSLTVVSQQPVTLSSGALNRSGEIVLAEYNSDGSLDSSFGTGGISTLDIYGAYAATLLCTSSGEIEVGAFATGGISCVVVAAFEADGDLDTSFGSNNGYYVIDMAYDPYAMTIITTDGTTDGYVLVVGWANHHGLFAAEYETPPV